LIKKVLEKSKKSQKKWGKVLISLNKVDEKVPKSLNESREKVPKNDD